MIDGGNLIFCFFTKSNGNCKKQEVRMVRGEQRLIRFLSNGWNLVKGLSNVRFVLKRFLIVWLRFYYRYLLIVSVITEGIIYSKADYFWRKCLRW